MTRQHRTKGGLTKYESRVLRMIRRGPKTYRAVLPSACSGDM